MKLLSLFARSFVQIAYGYNNDEQQVCCVVPWSTYKQTGQTNTNKRYLLCSWKVRAMRAGSLEYSKKVADISIGLVILKTIK